MRIVELIIDEDDDYGGIDAISIVEHPAIEENFVALSEKKEYKFKSVDEDKRLLSGALLIPNKTIFRRDKDDEYYIYFTRETVRKASELFLMKGNQNNSTFEHVMPLEGLSLVESWIIEDKENDKSNMYGMDLPLGTWFGTVKVNNESVWKEFVKTGVVKGFSIEGYFADKVKKQDDKEQIEAGLKLLKIKELLLENEIELETYNDYPESASNNAKRAIKYKEENGSSCGTQVGWTRARQLANKEKLSRDTISRMASFKRHQQNKDVPYDEGCGGLMWDCWGGASGINWAIAKLKSIDNEKKKK
jgi:hypothetical protein